MPGAQPRRGVMQRAASAVVRRAWVPEGVPGVYAVRRSPRLRPESQEPVVEWLQGPDYTVTVPLTIQQSWDTSVHEPLSTPDTTVLSQLRDGSGLFAGPVQNDAFSIRMYLPFGTDSESSPTEVWAALEIAPGTIGAPVALSLGEDQGTYIPPTPPPGYVLEYEAAATNGRALGDMTLEGEFAAGADEVGVPNTLVPGGSLWWTTETYTTYRTPAHIIANYTQMLSVSEQSLTPFTLTLDAETVYSSGDQSTVNLVIWPMSEAMTNTATMNRGPQGHAVAEARLFGPTLTATVRPPRHRFVPAPTSGDWIVSTDWNAYVWDAGLFLGSSFADVTGLPATCPVDASQLNYYVAPAASDVVGNDMLEPFGRFYRNDDGSFGEIVAPDPSATPDPGSHIWVIWVGPAGNVATDPEPSSPPAPLIPASLAENGTG